MIEPQSCTAPEHDVRRAVNRQPGSRAKTRRAEVAPNMLNNIRCYFKHAEIIYVDERTILEAILCLCVNLICLTL